MACKFALVCLLLALSSQATTATEAYCSFKEDTWSGATEPVYYCDVLNDDDFENARRTIDSIKGGHRAGKSNSDVKGFSMRFIISLKGIPDNIEVIFPGITHLNLFTSEMTEITKSDLGRFPNLKYLGLSSNEFRRIKGDTFELNPELEFISLDFNEISHIDANAFSSLKKLKVLELKGNNCEALHDAHTRADVEALVAKIENSLCN